MQPADTNAPYIEGLLLRCWGWHVLLRVVDQLFQQQTLLRCSNQPPWLLLQTAALPLQVLFPGYMAGGVTSM